MNQNYANLESYFADGFFLSKWKKMLHTVFLPQSGLISCYCPCFGRSEKENLNWPGDFSLRYCALKKIWFQWLFYPTLVYCVLFSQNFDFQNFGQNWAHFSSSTTKWNKIQFDITYVLCVKTREKLSLKKLAIKFTTKIIIVNGSKTGNWLNFSQILPTLWQNSARYSP